MSLKQVLILDDEVEFANLLGEFIDAMDQQISYAIAKDGLEGLEIFNVNEFDCIITDINMPNCGGVCFAEKLRDMGVNIPVIFVSGEGGEELEAKLKKVGAFDFLIKPIDPDDLGFVVENALEEAC